MSSNIEAFVASLPSIEKVVQDILSSYDTKTTPQVNIKQLVDNHSRVELEQCVNYIKTLKVQYPTISQRLEARKGKNKPDFAGDISIFINGVIEMDCEACGQQYCHTIAENSDGNNSKCFICNRYSHKSCYESEVIKQGLYFICSLCSKKKSDRSEVDVEFTEPTSDANTKQQDIEEEEKTHDTEAEVESHSETLCPLLQVGECPHGISGKGCSYKHPKWCWKYQRFGDIHPDGCRRSNCWYHHPKLCENSLKLKICLNKKCKLHHIEGTRRHQSREVQQQPYRSQPRDLVEQTSNSLNQPGNSFNQSREQWQQSSRPQSRNTFNVHSDIDFPHMEQQSNVNQKRFSPWKEELPSVETDKQMGSFLDQYTAKISSQLASTISAQVNDAVQRSIRPLKEEITQIGRSQRRELPTQTEDRTLIGQETTPITPIQDLDIQSLVKCLQNLIPTKT